jgi:CheY-like chemotaxis protein
MNDDAVILIAEDDDGHFALIKKNLSRAGIFNKVIQFGDGQELVDFLFMNGHSPQRESNTPYLLMLDIRMPKMDGIDVLTQIKQDDALSRIPVIMLTTTDDPVEIERCHALGCSMYIVKPVEYDKFTHTIRKLGSFFSVISVPAID